MLTLVHSAARLGDATVMIEIGLTEANVAFLESRGMPEVSNGQPRAGAIAWLAENLPVMIQEPSLAKHMSLVESGIGSVSLQTRAE